MKNELSHFTSESFGTIRIVKDGNCEPWFVAKDVCDILGITNSRDALTALDADEKGVGNIYTLGGSQKMATINESGLYALVLKSRKPEAKEFSRWVRREVLPSIRKHGGYLTPAKLQEALLNPDTLIQLAQNLKTEQKKNRLLEAQAETNAPKVLFADAVASSKTSILIGDLAKILKSNGINIGQNRLFAWMREHDYLCKNRGEMWNMPTQKSMELGLFEVKESTHQQPDGTVRITKTTKVTGKGQQYFINKFCQTGEQQCLPNS